MKHLKPLWFRRSRLALVFVFFSAAFFGGTAHAKEKQVICLVSGMQMKEKSMTEKHTYKGKTYSFCSKGAKDAFAKNPEKYLKKTFVCPIDGMKMKIADAVDAVEHEGKMHYFCMKGEKEKFLKSPEKYMQKKSQSPENKEKKKTEHEHMEGM